MREIADCQAEKAKALAKAAEILRREQQDYKPSEEQRAGWVS
jgi:hypothetical protein